MVQQPTPIQRRPAYLGNAFQNQNHQSLVTTFLKLILHYVHHTSSSCTEEEAQLMLGSLDVSKSNGPDGISARMLKSTSYSIAPAITKLFNMSIASGKLSTDWKSSLVVPIPKKGDPSNYCPISLLLVLSTVLERHMSNLLYDHLLEHAPISTKQWGFLPQVNNRYCSVCHS